MIGEELKKERKKNSATRLQDSLCLYSVGHKVWSFCSLYVAAEKQETAAEICRNLQTKMKRRRVFVILVRLKVNISP